MLAHGRLVQRLQSKLCTFCHHNPVDARRSLVVLCGWLGAKAAHLEKYASLVASMPPPDAVTDEAPEGSQLGGAKVMQFISPPLALLRSERFVAELFADFADRVIRRASVLSIAASGEPEPLVLYAFSGNGAISAGLLLQALRVRLHDRPRYKQGKLPLVLKGMIYDSAPCLIDEKVMARGYMGVVTSKLARRPVYTHAVLTPIFEPFFHLVLKHWKQRQQLLQEALQELLRLDLHEPLQLRAGDSLQQLFLVSKGDDVILLEDVQKFIDLQHGLAEERDLARGQKMASNVELVDFGVDSAHVRHLQHQPDKYKIAVYGFLRKVLFSDR